MKNVSLMLDKLKIPPIFPFWAGVPLHLGLHTSPWSSSIFSSGQKRLWALINCGNTAEYANKISDICTGYALFVICYEK